MPRSFIARWAALNLLAALPLLHTLPTVAQSEPVRSDASKSEASKPEPAKRIGIIGAGNIGGTLGALWTKAGYEVFLSSRHPEGLRPLVERLGPKARAGTVAEAIAFGEAVLIAVPYKAYPDLGREQAAAAQGLRW